MWLFTKIGMFSAVYKDGGIQIRSRNRKHLEALKRLCKQRLALIVGPIRDTPKGDYGWRIAVDPETWREIAAMLASEINYPNFKDAAKNSGVDRRYVGVLHDIWWRMFRYQSDGKPWRRLWKSEELPIGVVNHPLPGEDEGDSGTEFDYE